jgi:spore coat protein CotF
MQQQNNKIANPKPANEPQVKGPQMNDRDRINDILATEKYLTDGFNIAAREASHPQLHQDIMTILNETHQCAREAFEMMFQKGWYKIEAEDQSKLSQSFNQFNGYSSQFPFNVPVQ